MFLKEVVCIFAIPLCRLKSKHVTEKLILRILTVRFIGIKHLISLILTTIEVSCLEPINEVYSCLTLCVWWEKDTYTSFNLS